MTATVHHRAQPIDQVADGAADQVRSSPLAAGAVAMLPFVAGYVPFALAIGAAVAAHGDVLAAWAGSWIVYGGSAHLAMLQTLETSGVVAAVLTGALVNVRLVVYSASLTARWSTQPAWFRLAAAPLIIDPTWAVLDAQPLPQDASAERRFFAGAGLTLGAGWSAAMAVGVLLGERIDAGHLAVAVPLCLASLVGPRLINADTRSTCVAAGAAMLVAADLPAGSGLLVAAAAGVAAGAVADGMRA